MRFGLRGCIRAGLAVALGTCAAWGQLLPRAIGVNQLAETHPAPPAASEPGLWKEFGLEDSGSGLYAGPGGKFTLTLYRLSDATGALVAFDWLQPKDAKLGALSRLEADSARGVLVASGNYLMEWVGHRPTAEEFGWVLMHVPKFRDGQLPSLLGFLPKEGRRPNSERYIVGPATLAKVYPEIPSSAAAFHLSTEAVVGEFGKSRLIVFSFPTPEAARRQAAELEKIPGAVVKRTGPLAAVVVNPGDPNEAERVLGLVRYQADVTLPERIKTLKDNPANLLLNIALLIGVLIVFCAVSGLVFGGLQHVFRQRSASGASEEVVSLGLSQH